MADCYEHGYSGGPGPCPQCESGGRGPTLDSDSVVESADIASLGRKAYGEKLRREQKAAAEKKKKS
jgi:hypothetical protein